MEDDETQSPTSPESESHSPPSGRIAVTVASAAPSTSTPPPPPNSLTRAVPIQQPSSCPPSSATGGGGAGREDCWSEGATAVLIKAWGKRYMELSRGNLKQKHWKEVADIVSSREDYSKPPKTDIQCKNRIDTVKKKYKMEKAKVGAGGGPSRWPFFDRLDRLIGSSSASAAAGNSQKAVPVGIPVGIRPLSFPHLQPPPHLRQPPPPPQQIRQPRNFPSPSPVFPRFNSSPNTNNSSRQQQQVRRGPPMPPAESESEEGWSPESKDSLPPERKRGKVEVNDSGGGRERKGKKRKRDEKGMMTVWGNSVRELTAAILKFGEAYEAVESAKLQQIMEMEKQRMTFAKELELQRMKFLMKTQLQLSQLNGNGNGNNNNSDSRGGGSSGRRGGGGGGGGGDINDHHHHNENHLSRARSDSSD